MSAGIEQTRSSGVGRSATLSYLESRVREEANAAAAASSVEATIIHLVLATAYAKRFGECAGRNVAVNGGSWAEEHRIW